MTYVLVFGGGVLVGVGVGAGAALLYLNPWKNF
jgi:hypothetical protein